MRNQFHFQPTFIPDQAPILVATSPPLLRKLVCPICPLPYPHSLRPRPLTSPPVFSMPVSTQPSYPHPYHQPSPPSFPQTPNPHNTVVHFIYYYVVCPWVLCHKATLQVTYIVSPPRGGIIIEWDHQWGQVSVTELITLEGEKWDQSQWFPRTKHVLGPTSLVLGPGWPYTI